MAADGKLCGLQFQQGTQRQLCGGELPEPLPENLFSTRIYVAVLNNYGGFYNRKVYVNEAKVSGANICLPCVNRSFYNTTIYDTDIYLGFDGLQNLESKLAQRIVSERQTNGHYKSLENFALRTGAGLEQLIILIR